MSMWTAWGSLFEAAELELKPAATVLIHGATSSVGIWAILLAKNYYPQHNCTVIATTRNAEKVDKLKRAGADHVILESDLDSSLRKLYPSGVDCILELVGPDQLLPFTLQHLSRHGTAVASGVLTKQFGIPDFLPSRIPPTRKLSFYSTGVTDDGLEKVPGVMEAVVRKVESGEWDRDVFISRVFEGLEGVGEAHEFMEGNRAVGKVVVVVA